jgi:hypothetical protein
MFMNFAGKISIGKNQNELGGSCVGIFIIHRKVPDPHISCCRSPVTEPQTAPVSVWISEGAQTNK